MPNTRGAVNIGEGSEEVPRFSKLTEKDKADLDALAQDTGTDGRQSVPTMFLVIIPSPGEAIAIQDPGALARYRAEHPASVPEMMAACHYVADRIHDSMLSQSIAAMQAQMAASIQRQIDDADLVNKLNLSKRN